MKKSNNLKSVVAKSLASLVRKTTKGVKIKSGVKAGITRFY